MTLTLFDLDSELTDLTVPTATNELNSPNTYRIDPRLTRLSYSGRTLLHSCPRKFQLERTSKIPRERQESVTLSFGSVFGIGVQAQLANKSWEETVLEMFLAWSIDLLAAEPRTKKGFFEAIFAVRQFESIRNSALKDYELAYHTDTDGNTIPSVEFSFRITVFDEFKYRGYIDAVLKHKVTGELLVLEIKSTGYTSVNEATYGNSSQATGYSVVLDTVAQGHSSYQVWYLVYMTSKQEFVILPFTKHYSDRATWIQDLMMDCKRIEAYEAEAHYPSYGESCMTWGRECEFYGRCHMSDRALINQYSPDDPNMQDKDEGKYHVELNLLDLIDAQLIKG